MTEGETEKLQEGGARVLSGVNALGRAAHFPFGPRGSTVSGRHSRLMNVVISLSTSTGTSSPQNPQPKQVPDRAAHHQDPEQQSSNTYRQGDNRPKRPARAPRRLPPVREFHCLFLPAYQLTVGGFFPVSASPSSCRAPRASQAPPSPPTSPPPAPPLLGFVCMCVTRSSGSVQAILAHLRRSGALEPPGPAPPASAAIG